MPIYAYKCGSCGHAKDVLQKMSDAQLTVCPACGADAFTKQVTAAGFQLKGSGWYVTDFRGGNSGGAPAAAEGKTDAKAEAPSDGAAPAPSAAVSPSADAPKKEATNASTTSASAVSPSNTSSS